MKKTSVALALPPDGSPTCVGVTFQLGQDAHNGGGDVESAIVPLNPFMLVSSMVDVAFLPAGTFWLSGFAEIEKSGWPGPVTVREPTNCSVMKLPPCAALPVNVSL